MGGGSPYLGPSLCLPWAGNKAGVIGVALVMEGVALILLRFVFACCPRAWSVWRLVRWRGFGCLSRSPWEQAGWGMGLLGVRAQQRPPPRRRGPFWGRGGFTPALGRPEGRRPRGPLLASRGPEGGSGRRGEGFPTSLLRGGGLWPPAQTPLLRWRIPPRYTCSAGVVWQPRAPGAAWPAAGRSVWRGGGGSSVCHLPSEDQPRGPAGRGAGSTPCCGLLLRPPQAGTKAGRFVCTPPSKLHWLTSGCCRPVAAHGVPPRAGAGLLACLGHCGTG